MRRSGRANRHVRRKRMNVNEALLRPVCRCLLASALQSLSVAADVEQVRYPCHGCGAHFACFRRTRPVPAKRTNIKQPWRFVPALSNLVPLHCNMHRMRARVVGGQVCMQRSNARHPALSASRVTILNAFLFRPVRTVFRGVVEIAIISVAGLALILQYDYRV